MNKIKESIPWWVAILVALIGCIGVVCAATIDSDLIREFFSSPTSTPTFTSAISILNLQSADSNPIDKKYAPYEVKVNGIASNANGYYLYLIVDDATKKWIQKPLGLITDDNFSFSGPCYLGDGPTDPVAQNKTYIIYAVISANGLYKELDDFTGQTPIATSTPMELVRRDPPTP